MTKEKHIHKFKPREIKVTLREGTARDTLKQWVCACGKVETYDLEREVK